MTNSPHDSPHRSMITRQPRVVPLSPSKNGSMPALIAPLNPLPEDQRRKAMEAAAASERARSKEMEETEKDFTAAELRKTLRKERLRMGRMAADIAALRTAATDVVQQVEVFQEGKMNELMRQMSKGSVTGASSEQGDEKTTMRLQKEVDELRRGKLGLEQQLKEERKARKILDVKLADLRDRKCVLSEVLGEEEEMEEE